MTQRKRVAWDERNLEENEEYRRLHPVTMHITEPKTPYAHPESDEENFDEALMATGDEEDEEDTGTWDPEVNALARQLREELSKRKDGLVAPVSSTGRPMLSAGVTNGEMSEKRHLKKFQTMRKAIYADEGAKFKAQLSSTHKKLEDE